MKPLSLSAKPSLHASKNGYLYYLYNCLYSCLYIAPIMLLQSCSDNNNQPININFTLSYQQQAVNCDDFAKSNVHQLRDFRLYLHDIAVQDQQNRWHPLTLDITPWQNHNTVLLDFENGNNQCQQGTPATNTSIHAKIPVDTITALRFTLGVPFELNHQNPLTAKAPLNHSTMHWHWQGGYKFMRGEFNLNGQSLRVHIGSLQCQGQINNISHCDTPNRAHYQLDGFNGQQSIDIQLDTLINQTLTTPTLTCMGDNKHPVCANANRWAGLAANHQQSMFVLKAQNSQTNKKAQQ